MTRTQEFRATIRKRIAASQLRHRSLLLAELLNAPPQSARFGLGAKSWRRECDAAVLALPADHFVAKAFPEQRPPSILYLLRSVS